MKSKYNRFANTEEGLKLNKESNKRFDEWRFNNRITRVIDEGNQAWADLIPGKKYSRKYNIVEHSSNRGIFDHSILFGSKNDFRLFITQPYFHDKELSPLDCKMNKYENVLEWAYNRGLMVEYSFNDSWHYPDSTVLITFILDDSKKYTRAIKEKYEYCEVIERF